MATPNLSFQNFFTTTLASGITASDTTIYLNSLPTGSEGYLVIEPDSATNKEIIYYTSKGANFVTLPSVAAGRGVGGTTAVSHSSGVTVQMNVVAEHFKALQDGTAFAVGGIGASAYADGWTPILGSTPNTVTYNGNRNYDLVFNAVDLSSTISPGQRMKLTRTVAAPNQCTSLNGTTQYYSKATPSGITFTGNFTTSAWVKLSSYPTANAGVIERDSTTATASGWGMLVDTSGRVQLFWRNATGNSVVQTYVSLPLNKWVHIAAAATVATPTAAIYIDGVSTAVNVTASAATTVVQPAAATALTIGNRNSTSGFFPGKIAQAAVYSAAISAATLQGSVSQTLSGSETNLVSAYSFNNSINDLNTTNANNLTASGSAVATNADSPFANAVTAGLQEYAEINSVTYSTNTTVNVRVPFTSLIPTSGGISNVYYAVSQSPTGLPAFSNILGQAIIGANTTSTTANPGAQINGLTLAVTVPTNKTVKVSLTSAAISNSGANSGGIGLHDGAVGASTAIAQATGLGVTGAFCPISESATVTASGSKTFNAALYASAGTTTLSASITNPTVMTVELV